MIKYINVCVEPDGFMSKLVSSMKNKEKVDYSVSGLKLLLGTNISGLFVLPFCVFLNVYTSFYAYGKMTVFSTITSLYAVYVFCRCIRNIFGIRKKIKVVEKPSNNNDAIEYDGLSFAEAVHRDDFRKFSPLTAFLWLVYNTDIKGVSYDGKRILVLSELEEGICTSVIEGVIDKGDVDPNTVSVTNDAIFIGKYDTVLSHAMKSLVLGDSCAEKNET